jgi:hypothetical protein
MALKEAKKKADSDHSVLELLLVSLRYDSIDWCGDTYHAKA